MKRFPALLFLLFLLSICLHGQLKLVPFTDGEKWGYATAPDRKIMIPLKYSECEPFNSKGFALARENGQYIVIDTTGKELIRVPERSEYQQFSERTFMVSKDRKYGVYNLETGKFTGFIYTSMDAFADGYAPYNIDSYSGLLTEDGTQLFHGKFEKIYWPSQGLCAAQINGKWGYVNMDGNVVIPPQYGFAEPFSEGLANVGMGFQNSGFIDTTGKVVIPLEYGRMFGAKFRDGFVSVMKNGKQGCIDSKGNFVIPAEYSVARYEGDGIFVKGNGTDRGFTDLEGRRIIGEELPPYTVYSNGYFKVTKKTLSSFMDKKGKYMFPFFTSFQSFFKDGIVKAKYREKVVYVDTTGRMYCTFGIPVELLDAKKRDMLARADTLTLYNNYWIALIDNQVQIYDSLGKRVPPLDLVSYTTKDQYAVFQDAGNKYHFFKGKMQRVTGAEEKPLLDFFTKVDKIRWYNKWSDSLQVARKAIWIQLGNYKWALNDLAVTRYNNGDTIYQAKSDFDFVMVTRDNKPAMFTWSAPGKSKESPTTIYNMAAIQDKRGIIPPGYKIPNEKEWTDLMNFSGGDSIAGQFVMNIGFVNQGTLDTYGSNNNLMSLWLLEEQLTKEYISAVMKQDRGVALSFLKNHISGPGCR